MVFGGEDAMVGCKKKGFVRTNLYPAWGLFFGKKLIFWGLSGG
jgi:hypothetical protein